MKKLVLTAGQDRALHVVLLAALLQDSSVEISGIVVVTPFQWRRLSGIIKRRGLSFVRRSIKRILGMDKGLTESRFLYDALAKEGIALRSLKKLATQYGIPYKSARSLNDEESVAWVKERQADLIIYGGGGILRNAFLKTAKFAVLNAHSGPLPAIRGMNACEWSLLLDQPVTVTIHQIDEGIDTGKVIQEKQIQVDPADRVDDLRAKCIVQGVYAMLDVIINEGYLKEAPVLSGDAYLVRQGFILSPLLLDILQEKMKKRAL